MVYLLDQDRRQAFRPGVNGREEFLERKVRKRVFAFSRSIIRPLSSRTLVKKSASFTLGSTSASTGAICASAPGIPMTRRFCSIMCQASG
jgi:hypothetical protein